MIKFEHVDLALCRGTKLERKILTNLNLDIKNGEFVVIIGGNGAGKSTLFSLISGYRFPDSGSIIIDDKDVSLLPQFKRAALVAEVMQDPKMGTMENMTIEENMSFAYCRGKSRKLVLHNSHKRRKIFQDKLSMLDMKLENRMDELVGNLSGGQRQALALIMAISTDSKVLLLDEITAALDPKTAESVIKLAAHIVKEEQRTTLMITHNMDHAIHYGDRTLLLAHGNIFKEYTYDEKKTLTPHMLATDFCEH